MKRRTKLADRKLPNYTHGEEIMNMVTHIAGGGFAVIVLVLCLVRCVIQNNTLGVIGSAIYGGTMLILYCMSSIYHGLHRNTGKKVMQIIDHCAIYFLICGTYTPIMLCAFIPTEPVIGWGILAAQWILAITAATLTAIDLKKYEVFSMICYIGMGWCIILFIPTAIRLLTLPGFWFLLSGGIVYSIGAVLYGIGSKRRWMHSIFHIFVVVGSILQFLSIYLYVL